MEQLSKGYQYFFRADGNEKIGAGHLMRCLTIADALAEALGGREKICFLTSDERSRALVSEKGFHGVSLGTDCTRMEEELPRLKEFFRKEEVFREEGCLQPEAAQRRILADSYFVTDLYLSALKEFGQVWLLDDTAERSFPADAVINYNLYASPERYEELYAHTATRYYVGGSYVPVRPQFLEGAYELREQVQDVMITTGGGDSRNIALQVLKAIWREGLHYHVVVGGFSPHIQEWKNLEKTCPRIHVHVNVSDMAGLMRKCDLAVTAGGSTVYELAAAGVPFLCFSYAENQELLTEFIGKEKIGAFAGSCHKEPDGTLYKLAKLFDLLCGDPVKRLSYSRTAKQLIDGKGAYRISRLLTEGMQ